MPLRKIFLAVLLLTPMSAFATFNVTAQWDVRTTGSDTNGGAFDPNVTVPGTDESMGATGTSVSCVIQATTTQAICTPAISSTTHGPGNFVGPMTGAGCTASQWIELLSQSSGTGTFDKSLGTAGSTCVGTMGGSLLTLNQAGSVIGNYNTIHVQSGTYTTTTTIRPTNGNNSSTNQWEGYQTTHWDWGTKPLITTSTASTNLMLTGGLGSNATFFNFSFSNTAVGANKADGFRVNGAGGGISLFACILDGFATAVNAANASVGYTEIKNSTSSDIFSTISINVYQSWLHTGAVGIVINTVGPSLINIQDTYITDHTGRGINLFATFNQIWIRHCVIANNGSNGIDFTNLNAGSTKWDASSSGLFWGFNISNNIFYNNTGYGIVGFSSTSNGGPSDPTKPWNVFMSAMSNNNAYGANTSGDTLRWLDRGRITLTANPFVSSGTGNYAINTTAGGGALLAGLGWPSVMPGGIMSNYRDVGGVQHQATGGSGGNSGSTF